MFRDFVFRDFIYLVNHGPKFQSKTQTSWWKEIRLQVFKSPIRFGWSATMTCSPPLMHEDNVLEKFRESIFNCWFWWRQTPSRPERSVTGWMQIKPGPCLEQRWSLRPLVVVASILWRDQAAGYLSSTNKSRKSTFMRSLIFTIYLQNILCGFTPDGPEQKHTERRPSRSLTSSYMCREQHTPVT